ncbi:hypothetical protein Stok01_00709 [Sulfurisphaera tokodaii]
MASLNSVRQIKKSSCPFGRHCYSDSSICGDMGRYAECPEIKVVEVIQRG